MNTLAEKATGSNMFKPLGICSKFGPLEKSFPFKKDAITEAAYQTGIKMKATNAVSLH